MRFENNKLAARGAAGSEEAFTLDLLRGVSEVEKKSHFLSTRRLFVGV